MRRGRTSSASFGVRGALRIVADVAVVVVADVVRAGRCLIAGRARVEVVVVREVAADAVLVVPREDVVGDDEVVRLQEPDAVLLIPTAGVVVEVDLFAAARQDSVDSVSVAAVSVHLAIRSGTDPNAVESIVVRDVVDERRAVVEDDVESLPEVHRGDVLNE